MFGIILYYILINDTTLELSVSWPSDTEIQINELRFSESISLSFKTRLTSVTCFCRHKYIAVNVNLVYWKKVKFHGIVNCSPFQKCAEHLQCFMKLDSCVSSNNFKSLFKLCLSLLFLITNY